MDRHDHHAGSMLLVRAQTVHTAAESASVVENL